jgi:phosphoglycerol transferase MdoB-like AlkP superfamily enzyme
MKKNWFNKTWLENEYVVLLYQFAVLLFLYAVCRLLFYWFNIALFPNIGFADMLTIMRGGVKFDIAGLLYLNAAYMLLYIFPHPWKFANGYQKFLRWFFIIVNSLGIALNAIDFKYFPFILKRTTVNVYDILKNEQNMGSLALRFVVDYWYVYLIFGLLVAALVYLTRKPKPKPTPIPKWYFSYPFALAMLLLFSAFTVAGIRGDFKHSTRPITISNAGEYVRSAEQVYLVVNTPFCLIRTFNNKSFTKMNFYSSENELAKDYNPVMQLDKAAPTLKKNVVVIILESFAREHFGVFNKKLDNGTYKGYTPFLDSLAQHSLVFPNAFANGRKSIDAMPSVLASLPALVLPYVVSEYSTNKINSLASLLGEEGYQTSFFHGAPNGSMGFLAFSKLAGFNGYFGKTEYNNDADFDGMWGIWDEPFLKYWGQQMGQMKKPFFTALFSVSSHHPFKVPAKYEGVFPKGKLPLHQCVGYTDHSLRSFFNSIKNEPWFKNTLFVITADHSAIPVHEEYKSNVNAFAIPLIFYTPDGSLKGIDNRLAQQIDIMPSVLSYLGYKKPFITFGTNLFSNSDKPFVINYIGDAYQFMMDDTVIYFDGKKITQVFDFAKDPMLKNNLLGKADISAYEKKMKAVLQQYNNRMIENRLVVNR